MLQLQRTLGSHMQSLNGSSFHAYAYAGIVFEFAEFADLNPVFMRHSDTYLAGFGMLASALIEQVRDACRKQAPAVEQQLDKIWYSTRIDRAGAKCRLHLCMLQFQACKHMLVLELCASEYLSACAAVSPSCL